MPPITLSRQRHGQLVDCLADRVEPVARSPRFTIYHLDPEWPANGFVPEPDDIVLVHDFARSEIDNNVARHVAEELLPLLADSVCLGAGAGGHQEVFERFVGEIVRSMEGSERRAWHLFYDNTLAALERTGRTEQSTACTGPVPTDYIADFAAIYRQVAELVTEVRPDAVLDVATCFGFLPLLLASGAWSNGARERSPQRVVACDLNPALVSLAQGYAQRRQLSDTRFVCVDILATGAVRELTSLASSYDVVTAIHFLEHLEPAQTALALDVLWSLARRRLVVSVPVEEHPDSRFGHRQVFTRDSLSALGQRADGTYRCFELHGAWLVIDRKNQGSNRSPSNGAGELPGDVRGVA